jgi:methyltransferase (TIGR00027 family)
MNVGQVSQTAISTALFRAAHLHLFDAPAILRDTFALQLSGLGDRDALDAFGQQVEARGFPLRRASAYFAYRHRVSEDRMQAALDQGIAQILILGAGLDSFALRHPEIPARVRFVEIDHPATQRWKLDRLAALGLETPGVRYVSVDFASERLTDGLEAAGVDSRERIFVAWLGVTQYIRRDAAEETLDLVTRHAAGSAVVFDVILPPDAQSFSDAEMSRMSSQFSVARGEPWISYYDPETLVGRLATLGFARIERLAAAEARAYYAGQPADVAPVDAWQMIIAHV